MAYTKEKQNEYMKQWYKKMSPEKKAAFLKKHRDDRLKEIEKYRLRDKNFSYKIRKEKDPIKLKETMKKGYEKYKFEHGHTYSADLYKKDPEKAKQRQVKWKLKYPEKWKLIQKNAKAKRKGAEGKYTKEEWENLKKRYEYTCPCCHRKEPEIVLHADHIFPLVKGGDNYITNIQPLCKTCNSSKGAKFIKFDFTVLLEIE